MYKVIEYNEYLDGIGDIQVRINPDDTDDIQLTFFGDTQYPSLEQFNAFAVAVAKIKRAVNE